MMIDLETYDAKEDAKVKSPFIIDLCNTIGMLDDEPETSHIQELLEKSVAVIMHLQLRIKDLEKLDKYVVVFDTNEYDDNNRYLGCQQVVKLYHDSIKASNAIFDYCNNFRNDMYWKYKDNEENLNKRTPNTICTLYGYKVQVPTIDDVPEIITLYRLTSEDSLEEYIEKLEKIDDGKQK